MPEKIVHLWIQGEPVGKARARTVRTRGGGVHSYTPGRTVEWEDRVRLAYRQAYGGVVVFERTDAVKATLSFRKLRPKSWPKSKRFWTQKPDGDNLGKAVLDSLNYHAYADDSQVVKLDVEKLIVTDPAQVGALITLELVH